MKKIRHAGVALFKDMGELYGLGVMLGKRTCASSNNKWAFPGSVINPEIDKSLFEAASERFAKDTSFELFRVVQNGKSKVLKIKLPFFEWETYCTKSARVGIFQRHSFLDFQR